MPKAKPTKKKTSPKRTAKKKTSPKKTAKKKTSPKTTAKKKTSPKRTAKKKTSPKKTAAKKKAPAKKNREASGFAGFGAAGTLSFLADLKNNNAKAWFDPNKQRYEDEVRGPALDFVRAMEPGLKKLSKHLVASDKKVGGSLMRVYRDVRFSKDKTPYKTNVGIHFKHERGKDVHAPGVYVHLGLDGCFMGMGLWRPEKDALAAIRNSIATSPAKWKKVLDDPALRAVWRSGGDSLKRPPKGFDPEHEMIDELKRKDHILVADLTVDEAEASDFVEVALERFAVGKKHMRLLCQAVGVAF